MIRKIRRDWVFIIVMASVLGNLGFQTAAAIVALLNGQWANVGVWTIFLADLIAIMGTLWLMRNYARNWRREISVVRLAERGAGLMTYLEGKYPGITHEIFAWKLGVKDGEK